MKNPSLLRDALVMARHRARLRRDSDGAAIFIVAVTLGLLAAMGVYGLSATSNDIKAAGHMRQSAQAAHAAELSLMATAETFTPRTSAALVQTMGDVNNHSTGCVSSRPWTGSMQTRTAESCLILTETQMRNIAGAAGGENPFSSVAFFPSSPFGGLAETVFLRVELTNPVDMPAPSGTDLAAQFAFTQLTASVFVDLRPGAGLTSPKTVPADTSMLGRGRITVGPYFK